MKTDFHNKDLALRLSLKWRLLWTRKWPIRRTDEFHLRTEPSRRTEKHFCFKVRLARMISTETKNNLMAAIYEYRLDRVVSLLWSMRIFFNTNKISIRIGFNSRGINWDTNIGLPDVTWNTLQYILCFLFMCILHAHYAATGLAKYNNPNPKLIQININSYFHSADTLFCGSQGTCKELKVFKE